MKIAVIGANGFVGRNLTEYLSMNHDVYAVARNTVNLLHSESCIKYFNQHKFDVVVNAAAVMTNSDLIDDTYNNLGLFMNLVNCKSSFGKLINLGSGAEFDRTTDINSISEDDISLRLPKDSYGFGQNIKSRICLNESNFYTLRIFNCFGPGELSTRLFPRLISASDTFDISNDRYFDYFSIQDLCTVVENFAINTYAIKDVNCVYQEKLLISQVAEKFTSIKNKPLNINITSTSGNNYTGDGTRLAGLNFNLQGLTKAFQNY